jgi:hypothetical protein
LAAPLIIQESETKIWFHLFLRKKLEAKQKPLIVALKDNGRWQCESG